MNRDIEKRKREILGKLKSNTSERELVKLLREYNSLNK